MVFELYPDIKTAYNLNQQLRGILDQDILLYVNIKI